jgi:hypothetical protein
MSPIEANAGYPAIIGRPSVDHLRLTLGLIARECMPQLASTFGQRDGQATAPDRPTAPGI